MIPTRKTVKDQNISLLWGREVKLLLRVMIPHFFKACLQDFLVCFEQLQGLLPRKTVITPVASAKTLSSSLHLSLPFVTCYLCIVLCNHFRASLGLCAVLQTSQVFSHTSKSSTCSLAIFQIFINKSGSLQHLFLGFYSLEICTWVFRLFSSEKFFNSNLLEEFK